MNATVEASGAPACPLCGPSERGGWRIGARISRSARAPYRIVRCDLHDVEFAAPGEHPGERGGEDGQGAGGEDGQEAGGEDGDGAAAKQVLDQFYGELDDLVSPRYAQFMDRVERATEGPGRLHDVGCGNGQLLVEARRRGWTVQGNDLVPAVGPALQARAIPYFLGSLSELALTPASCRVVTSFCVLPHHLVDPRPDLHAVGRLLEPDGWFIAEMPRNGLYRRVAWALYRLSRGRVEMPLANIYQPQGHVFGFSPESIRLLLERCGFDRVRTEPYQQPASLSTARFATRGWPFRIAARLVVGGLALAAGVLRQPNHMLVLARVPASGRGTTPTNPGKHGAGAPVAAP